MFQTVLVGVVSAAVGILSYIILSAEPKDLKPKMAEVASITVPDGKSHIKMIEVTGQDVVCMIAVHSDLSRGSSIFGNIGCVRKNQ